MLDALIYKSWLESRYRFLAALAIASFFLLSSFSNGPKSPASMAFRPMLATMWLIVAMLGGMVAGAGINTQPGLQAGKGLHGSMLYTLSMPVSRLRLLAIRAGIGWMEMAIGIAAMCSAMWLLFPALREIATPREMLQHTLVLIACGTGLFSIPVLLATFLDDQGRLFGNFFILGMLYWLCNHIPLPDSVNIFRAMGEGSPLLAHTIPWTAMACSLGLGALSFFAALKVVQSREY